MRPTGFVIYEGPSQLDLSPIVVVAIVKSSNRKTANMLQTYIIRSDVDPITANRTGLDYAICGHCPHRGQSGYIPNKTEGLAPKRSCYVNLGQGPLGVYRTLCKGKYPRVTGHAAIAAIGRGRMVRIGTYGDGAAVPGYIWDSLTSEAEGHTAYSHQRHVASASFDARRYMVSADSLEAAQDAWNMGARTFRVVRDVSDLQAGREILCPASEEAGKRTTCARCGLCAGASIAAKSIAIVAHGAGASHFEARHA
jgi:hypothetical protein